MSIDGIVIKLQGKSFDSLILLHYGIITSSITLSKLTAATFLHLKLSLGTEELFDVLTYVECLGQLRELEAV
jgi:hypothetical protein